MAATSVTGVGKGSSTPHMTIGVSNLIGPRFNEQHEKAIASNRKLVIGLVISQVVSWATLLWVIFS